MATPNGVDEPKEDESLKVEENNTVSQLKFLLTFCLWRQLLSVGWGRTHDQGAYIIVYYMRKINECRLYTSNWLHLSISFCR